MRTTLLWVVVTAVVAIEPAWAAGAEGHQSESATAVEKGAEPARPANEDFRVENKVYVDNDKEPRSEGTTIFYRGMVYDYLKKPAETTVFDPSRGRFVLLDAARRVKTEVSTQKLSAFTDALKRWAGGQNDSFLQFLVDPKFEEQLDEDNQTLTLTSDWMTYTLSTTETGSDAVSRQYQQFSDWYAQLNTLLTPGSRPPFPRLAVNAALARRKAFPSETTLTLRLRKGIAPKRITIRSEHQLVQRLIESDRDRVAQTDQFLAMFKQVSFEEYQEHLGR